MALLVTDAAHPRAVLVVDDDLHARTIHREWLEHAGYQTFGADSGEAGWGLALRWRPAMILIDLKMPGVDGWKLMEWLREDSRTHGTVLIALTIVGPGEDRRDPVRRGFDEHWVKPISATDLLTRTERLIGSPRSL